MKLDLLSGAQAATVEILEDQLPTDQRELIFTALPQNIEPPFHLIGDIDTDNIASKGEQLEEITLDVHSVYRGGDRAVLLAMLHAVRTATDGNAVLTGGARYSFQFHSAAASSAASDGVTFAGLTTLIITAEPA